MVRLESILLLTIILIFAGCTKQSEQEDIFTPEQKNQTTTNENTINLSNASEEINSSPNQSAIVQQTVTNDSNLELENEESKLTIYYFYSPLCFASKTIKPKIDELEIKYNSSVKFIRYNVLIQNDLEIYNNFTAQYNVSQRVVPLVFVNNTYFAGMFEINDSLENLILKSIERD